MPDETTAAESTEPVISLETPFEEMFEKIGVAQRKRDQAKSAARADRNTLLDKIMAAEAALIESRDAYYAACGERITKLNTLRRDVDNAYLAATKAVDREYNVTVYGNPDGPRTTFSEQVRERY